MDKIKVSAGTAQVLGLAKFKQVCPPKTAYFLLGGRCINTCAFCAQGSGNYNKSSKFLSRISWNEFSLREVLERLKISDFRNKFSRVCLQTTTSQDIKDEILCWLRILKQEVKIPVSVSTNIIDMIFLKKLFKEGLDNLTIPLDCMTPALYEKLKKTRDENCFGKDDRIICWNDVLKVLLKLSKLYPGKISTHLILGLGEEEADTFRVLIRLSKMGIMRSLFAFTPIDGTVLEDFHQPDIGYYRRTQLLNYILTSGRDLKFFLKDGRIKFKNRLLDFLKFKDINFAFQTSGCAGCNRPYYNETPGRVIYNYPRILKVDEMTEELKCALGV